MSILKAAAGAVLALLFLASAGFSVSQENGIIVRTYFGDGILGNTNGTNVKTRFAMPSGVCIDNNGNLIVFDTYNAGIKRIRDGKSETILGFSGTKDDYGFTRPYYLDGKQKEALLGRPVAGVYAPNGDLFIVDRENHAIRLLRGDTVYTFAGGEEGFADEQKGLAKFRYPSAIAIDKNGILYVADTQNHCIRKITADGKVSTIAGSPGKAGCLDGGVNAALFYEPSGIAVDGDGTIYVADTGNHLIRKIQNGTVSTIAGTYVKPEAGEDYSQGSYADGPASSARFNAPSGLCFAEGVLFIADTGNHAVRALDKNNTVSTVAGNREPGDADGPQSISQLNMPTSVIYADGLLYIADALNNKIKTVAIDPKGW